MTDLGERLDQIAARRHRMDLDPFRHIAPVLEAAEQVRSLRRDEWLRVLDLDPGSRAGKGRLQGLRRRVDERESPAQARVLDRLLALPLRAEPQSPPEPPWGPQFARVAADDRRALSAADVAWLDRLPGDPTEISETDARRLVQLAEVVKDGSDAWLVGAKWDPLHAIWQRKVFEVEERNRMAAAAEPVHGGPGVPGQWPAEVVREFEGVLGDLAVDAYVAEVAAVEERDEEYRKANPLAPSSAPDRALLKDSVAVHREALAVAAQRRYELDLARYNEHEAARQRLAAGPPPFDPGPDSSAVEAGRRRAEASNAASAPFDPTSFTSAPANVHAVDPSYAGGA